MGFPNNKYLFYGGVMKVINVKPIIKKLQDDYHGMISDESMKIYKIIEMLDEAPTLPEYNQISQIFEVYKSSTYICSICGNIIFPDVNFEDGSINISSTSCESRGGKGNKVLKKNICEHCRKRIGNIMECAAPIIPPPEPPPLRVLYEGFKDK